MTVRAVIEVAIPVFATSKQLGHLCQPKEHPTTVLVRRLLTTLEQEDQRFL